MQYPRRARRTAAASFSRGLEAAEGELIETLDRDVPPEMVERCRWEPDRRGLERALLAHSGVVDDSPWETLVAFCVATE